MRWLIATLLLCTALSGCTTDETPDAEPTTDSNVITDPQDYSYVETDGEGWHVHDYWQGQDRLTLIDMDRSCLSCTYSSGLDSIRLTSFRPEPDHVVPQGTQWLNITVDWSIESGEYEAVALYAKPANAAEAKQLAIVEPGQSVLYESTNEENDPPHQSLSLWEFQLVALGGAEGTEVRNWQASIHIEVVRGLEIPPYPPHPDFWQGTNELLLGAGEKGGSMFAYEVNGGQSIYCFGGCLGRVSPDDSAVVPYDADRVEFRIDGQPGNVLLVGLRAHGANSWDFSEIAPSDESPTHRTWTIDPEVHYGDSPYALQSLWEFELFVDEDTPAKAWAGTLDYTITAYKDA